MSVCPEATTRRTPSHECVVSECFKRQKQISNNDETARLQVMVIRCLLEPWQEEGGGDLPLQRLQCHPATPPQPFAGSQQMFKMPWTCCAAQGPWPSKGWVCGKNVKVQSLIGINKFTPP